MLDEISRPFALYISVAYFAMLVNSIPIMANETGKSHTMLLRNEKRTSADNHTSRPVRKATCNSRTSNAENDNNNIDGDGCGDDAASTNNTTETVVDNDNIVTGASGENQETDVVTDNHNNANNTNNADDEDDEDNDEDDTMSKEIDRSHIVTIDSLGKIFPAPDAYDYVDIAGDPDLYARVPWFDHDAVLTEGLLD